MTTPVAPPAPDTSPPSAPGALSATAVSGSRVDLSWGTATDNVAVTGYRVERCQGTACGDFAQIATTAGTTTSYSDTRRTAATSYSYRVRATTPPATSARTPTPPPPRRPTDTSPPSAPGTAERQRGQRSLIDLDLGHGDRQRRCHRLPRRALRGGAPARNFAEIGTTTATTTAVQRHDGLAPDTTYRYRVRATDAASNLGPLLPPPPTRPHPVPDTSAAIGTHGADAPPPSAAPGRPGLDLRRPTTSPSPATASSAAKAPAAPTSPRSLPPTGTTTVQRHRPLPATSYSYRVLANDAASQPQPRLQHRHRNNTQPHWSGPGRCLCV